MVDAVTSWPSISVAESGRTSVSGSSTSALTCGGGRRTADGRAPCAWYAGAVRRARVRAVIRRAVCVAQCASWRRARAATYRLGRGLNVGVEDGGGGPHERRGDKDTEWRAADRYAVEGEVERVFARQVDRPHDAVPARRAAEWHSSVEGSTAAARAARRRCCRCARARARGVRAGCALGACARAVAVVGRVDKRAKLFERLLEFGAGGLGARDRHLETCAAARARVAEAIARLDRELDRSPGDAVVQRRAARGALARDDTAGGDARLERRALDARAVHGHLKLLIRIHALRDVAARIRAIGVVEHVRLHGHAAVLREACDDNVAAHAALALVALIHRDDREARGAADLRTRQARPFGRGARRLRQRRRARQRRRWPHRLEVRVRDGLLVGRCRLRPARHRGERGSRCWLPARRAGKREEGRNVGVLPATCHTRFEPVHPHERARGVRMAFV
eukprot:4949735-Prymnesium_polylepis.1